MLALKNIESKFCIFSLSEIWSFVPAINEKQEKKGRKGCHHYTTKSNGIEFVRPFLYTLPRGILAKINFPQSWPQQDLLSMNVLGLSMRMFPPRRRLTILKSDLKLKRQLFELVILWPFLVILLPITLIFFTKLRFWWSFWGA